MVAARVAHGVDVGPWEPDPLVPDEDQIFFRVFTEDFVDEDQEIKPRFFRNNGAGMSGDWSRYCVDPEDTRRRSETHGAGAYCVRQIGVLDVRSIMKGNDRLRQEVAHSPHFVAPRDDRNNRSHVDVTGPKDKRECGSKDDSDAVRNEYASLSSWAIRPPGSVPDAVEPPEGAEGVKRPPETT